MGFDKSDIPGPGRPMGEIINESVIQPFLETRELLRAYAHSPDAPEEVMTYFSLMNIIELSEERMRLYREEVVDVKNINMDTKLIEHREIADHTQAMRRLLAPMVVQGVLRASRIAK